MSWTKKSLIKSKVAEGWAIRREKSKEKSKKHSKLCSEYNAQERAQNSGAGPYGGKWRKTDA